MTTKKCRAKNPATCRYHGKPAKPKHRIYSAEARDWEKTENYLKDWEKTENYLKNILVKNLPDEYVTELTGGNNSTAPDILIKKGDTHCLRIETKIIPSIAGIQMVVNKNETTGTYSTRQGEVFTKKLLHIINNNSEINSKKSVELTGVQAVEAFEAFESKYVDSKVGLFVGQFASNGLFVACEPTKEKLAQFFTPKIIIRKKRSGSRKLPYSLREKVKSILTGFDFNMVVQNDGRLHVQYPSDKKRERVQRVLNEFTQNESFNLFVSKNGEIRLLAKTNNVTALLSLAPKPGLKPEDFFSEEQVVSLVESKIVKQVNVP